MDTKRENWLLELKQISFAYGSKQVLNHIDLNIRSRGITVLLGPNGAGKSTLLQLIAGAKKTQGGKILLNEIAIDWQDQSFKNRVGYLPEFPFYYPFLTVLEMMRLMAKLRNIPKEQIEQRIEYGLNRFELAKYKDYTMDELSQGTKKRVFLGATLLHNPDILVLDEPTNGLDPDQVINMREALQEFSNEGGLVLLSTHIIGLAEKLANSVAILRNGKIIYSGENQDDLEALYSSHGQAR